MQSRREFLGTLGRSAIGASLLGCVRATGFASHGRQGHIPIGLQLYTVRSLMARDFDGTLARVADIGYREVEFAGYFGRTPAQVREALARHGLRAPSTHIALPADDAAWARTLEDAKAIGHDWVTIAWLDAPLRSSPADWARVADRFNHLGRLATEAGLRYAVLSDVVLERRLHTQNNGLRERDSRSDYLTVIRAALERRRTGSGSSAV